jgi:hypothetical protein
MGSQLIIVARRTQRGRLLKHHFQSGNFEAAPPFAEGSLQGLCQKLAADGG